MKREFKGIWIPKHIWLNKRLSFTEKLILVEIDSYDNDFGCIATNKTLCEDLQIQPSTVSGVIKSLENKGFIDVTYKNYNTFEGRKITMKTVPFGNPKGASEKSGGASEKSIPSNIFSNTFSEEDTKVSFVESTSSSSTEIPLELLDGIKKKKSATTLHSRIIKLFFEDLHSDFIFSSAHGKQVKEIINKTTQLFKKKNREVTDDSVFEFLSIMLNNLPEWYKSKDLTIINSKFNEIIEELKKSNNGQTRNNKPVSKYATSR